MKKEVEVEVWKEKSCMLRRWIDGSWEKKSCCLRGRTVPSC